MAAGLGSVKSFSFVSSDIQLSPGVPDTPSYYRHLRSGPSRAAADDDDDDDDDAESLAVGIQFYLFDQETNITLGDLTFGALPSLAKFALNISSWPWMNVDEVTGRSDGFLEMRLAIRPSFSSVERLASASNSSGLTTFILRQSEDDPTLDATRLRLINAVTMDDELVYFDPSAERQGVEFEVDASSSELVLRFAFFNRTLFYDPGTCALFFIPPSSSIIS